MTSVSASFSRDENFVPIQALGFTNTKAITYAALTTGAVGTTTLFNVTGVVAVRIFAIVSGVDLTGSGTLEVGISGNTPSLLAQVNATALDVGEIWTDNTPATVKAISTQNILSGTNVIQTIGTDTVTAGTVTYYCLWFPISTTGNVTSA